MELKFKAKNRTSINPNIAYLALVEYMDVYGLEQRLCEVIKYTDGKHLPNVFYFVATDTPIRDHKGKILSIVTEKEAAQ